MSPDRPADSDFEKALKELWAICGGLSVTKLLSNEKKLDKVVEFLGDPYVGAPGFSAATERLNSLPSPSNGKLSTEAYRAVLSLFCFFGKAEDFSRLGNDPLAANGPLKEANGYLADLRTVELLNGLYGIPDPYHARPGGCVRLHKTGSTSVILVASGILAASKEDTTVALKIIKPAFIQNPTIRRATLQYASDFHGGDGTHSPKVHKGNDRLIVMEFVRGETLAEYCSSTLWNRQRSPKERLLLVQHALLGVIAALKHHYNPSGKLHLDLSPDNILVAGENPLCIKLVDFGVNHVLRSGAYTKGDLDQLLSYVSPEVRDAKNETVRSDVYSVGVIAVELLHGKRLTRGLLPEALAHIADRYPVLAKLLEELVSGVPERRLVGVGDPRAIYDVLSVRLEQAAELAEEESGFVTAAKAIFARFSNVDPGVLRNMNEFSWNALWMKDARESSHISSWRWVNILLFVVSGICAFIWMFVGRNPRWLSGDASALSAFLVATSTMFVVFRYYDSIFGRISAGSISIWTNRFLRANALGAPLLLVMFLPLHLDGRPLYAWWSLCILPTTASVIVNNFLCWRLAKRIVSDETVKSDLGPESMLALDRWPAEFAPWWSLMLGYLAGVLLVGGGLWYWSSATPPSGWWSSFIPHDQLAYAVVILALNCKMFLLNCGKDARKVRTNLARLFWAKERTLAGRRNHPG